MKQAESKSAAVEIAIAAIIKEHARAEGKFGSFKNPHEAFAVLYEEVDELWDEVKRSWRDADGLYKEVIQVAAMSLRLAVDCCLFPPLDPKIEIDDANTTITGLANTAWAAVYGEDRKTEWKYPSQAIRHLIQDRDEWRKKCEQFDQHREEMTNVERSNAS